MTCILSTYTCGSKDVYFYFHGVHYQVVTRTFFGHIKENKFVFNNHYVTMIFVLYAIKRLTVR